MITNRLYFWAFPQKLDLLKMQETRFLSKTRFKKCKNSIFGGNLRSIKCQNEVKITYKFDFLAENLSKKQILDVKILKPDLKMQKLDLKHQKLDLPGFLGSGGD